MIESASAAPAGNPTGGYPLRLASIDVGSNALRFLAAELRAPGHWRRLGYARAAVRLGHDAFSVGRLSTEVMDAAVAALRAFRARMAELGVDGYRAVATSAVRESRNGAELMDRVRAECGLELACVDAAEEARLVWFAIRGRVDLGDQAWALVDVGGGSVELSRVDARGVRWTESYPLGTVRLLESSREGAGDSLPSLRQRLVGRLTDLERSSLAGESVAGLIATGGNIEALADLAGPARPAGGTRVVPLARLDALTGQLAGMTPGRRAAELGLRPDRADVILPAALVYAAVARLAKMDELRVPDVGLKEGVLLELAERLTRRDPAARPDRDA